MFIGKLFLDLYISEATSLKDKRRVVKSLVDKLRRRFNVSVAEIDYHDYWQRALVGVAAVSNRKGHVEQILGSVAAFVEREGTVETLECTQEIL